MDDFETEIAIVRAMKETLITERTADGYQFVVDRHGDVALVSVGSDGWHCEHCGDCPWSPWRLKKVCKHIASTMSRMERTTAIDIMARCVPKAKTATRVAPRLTLNNETPSDRVGKASAALHGLGEEMREALLRADEKHAARIAEHGRPEERGVTVRQATAEDIAKLEARRRRNGREPAEDMSGPKAGWHNARKASQI